MKKSIKMVVCLAIIMSLFALLIGCDLFVDRGTPGTGEVIPELVGTWEWPTYPDWRYVFNADGTGNRGVVGVLETFTWSVDGNTLHIDRDAAARDEIKYERWTMILSGDDLDISSQQEDGLRFQYVRAG